MSEIDKEKKEGTIKKVGAKTGMGITWVLVILVIVFVTIGIFSSWILGDNDAKKVTKINSSVTTVVNSNGSMQYINTETNEIIEQTELVGDLSNVLKKYMKGTDEEIKNNIEYLMGAEAVTTMPYISEEEKEKAASENGEDLDENELSLIGQIKFYRYTEGSQSNEENKVDVELSEDDRIKYVSPNTFENMLKSYENGQDPDGELFKYFTLEDGSVIIAYGTREERRVTTGGEGGIADSGLTEKIVNENSTETYSGDYVNGFGMVKYTVGKKTIDYRSLVEQYVMPANLLYCLLIQTGDIEFTKAIAGLAYENEIAIGIYDNNSESRETVDYKYKKLIELNSLIAIDLEKIKTTEEDGMPNVTSSTIASKVHENNLLIPVQHQSVINSELQLKHRVSGYFRKANMYGEWSDPTDDVFYVENLNSNNQITNLVSNENANNFLVKYYKQVNTKSIPTVGVILADTWVAKWTATYLKEDQSPINSSSSDTLEDTILATYDVKSGDTSILNEFSTEYRSGMEVRLDEKFGKMKTEAKDIIAENTDFSVEPKKYTKSEAWTDTATGGGRQYIRANLKTWVESCSSCRKAVSDWYKRQKGEIDPNIELLPNDGEWGTVFTAVANRTLGNSHVRTCINNNRLGSYVNARNEQYKIEAEAEADKREERFKEALEDQITLKSQTLYGKKKNVQISFTSTSVKNSSTHKRDETIEMEEEGKKFSKIFNDKKYYYSREAITGRTGWLWTYIRKNDDTAKLENVVRYLLNIATGTEDYGIFTKQDIIELLTMFQPKEEMKPATGTSAKALRDYIRSWENQGLFSYINGTSGYTEYVKKYINKEKTEYYIRDDGKGHPTVGFGVDIYNGPFLQRFLDAGYTDAQLKDISGAVSVPVEFVDELEEEEINNCLKEIREKTDGLNLENYQVYALVSRAYNCGVSGAINGYGSINFVNAYQQYYNSELDNKYGDYTLVDFNHALYVNFMDTPIKSDGEVLKGLIDRRESEWRLFQTGYMDRIGKYASAGDIIQIAQELHDAQMHWYYYSDSRAKGELKYNDIEASINNPGEVTCCATYVASVVYLAGYVTEDEINGIAYNGCDGLYNLLANKQEGKWMKITSSADLEPGDIVFMREHGITTWDWDHTQIYAGDGTWYNAGGSTSIREPAPRSSKYWESAWDCWIALRPI